jgi:prevent-host-death family protein
MRKESVSNIRQRLATFIREVNYTKEPILITEHGAPVAVLSPVPEELIVNVQPVSSS